MTARALPAGMDVAELLEACSGPRPALGAGDLVLLVLGASAGLLLADEGSADEHQAITADVLEVAELLGGAVERATALMDQLEPLAALTAPQRRSPATLALVGDQCPSIGPADQRCIEHEHHQLAHRDHEGRSW